MKVWFCYILAGLCGLLGLAVIPECVRDARRIDRLPREGQRISGEIIRIEEESRENDGTRYTVETATVIYSFAGKQYQSRNGMPGPGRSHRPGDKITLLVLPDEPERAWAPHEVTGNWIMTFMTPAILLLGAAMAGFTGWLLADVSKQKRG
jgi:hypothetical protein